MGEKFGTNCLPEILGKFADGTYSNKWGGGDQDFLWAIAKYRPELFRELPKSWNVTKCRRFYGVKSDGSNAERAPCSQVLFTSNCMGNQFDSFAGWDLGSQLFETFQLGMVKQAV